MFVFITGASFVHEKSWNVVLYCLSVMKLREPVEEIKTRRDNQNNRKLAP